MSENIYMEQKVISVRLSSQEEKDVLIFEFANSINEENCTVNMNSEKGKEDLLEVFSILLKVMMEKKIKLKYVVDKDYNKGLYKDVAEQYIKDLNDEIDDVYDDIEKKYLLTNN